MFQGIYIYMRYCSRPNTYHDTLYITSHMHLYIYIHMCTYTYIIYIYYHILYSILYDILSTYIYICVCVSFIFISSIYVHMYMYTNTAATVELMTPPDVEGAEVCLAPGTTRQVYARPLWPCRSRSCEKMNTHSCYITVSIQNYTIQIYSVKPNHL